MENFKEHAIPVSASRHHKATPGLQMGAEYMYYAALRQYMAYVAAQ